MAHGGAARVLRRYPEPGSDFLEPLLAALVGIPQRDDVVRFDTAGDEGGEGEVTTAVAEALVQDRAGWAGRLAGPTALAAAAGERGNCSTLHG